MALRDLIYKIVPPKIVVRELRTTTGKVLTKDSEYTLVEKKQTKMVNKKQVIDYVFELDLKEPEEKETEEVKKENAAQEKQAKIPRWYLNLEDFSLFKLRSAIYLMQFPLAFTMAMVNVWYKILPENPANDEKFSKEEIE